ncbi:MAG: asparaginase domain-containing protein [Phycisphaerales bacterium]
MRHLTLITTGGTIEKTYDELTGRLENRRSIVRRMLGRLRLEDTAVRIVELLSKDSLDMTETDRDRIVNAVRAALSGEAAVPAATVGAPPGGPVSGIVILHGTDTLCTTGERLHAECPRPAVPIVLTGAMRPFEMRQSDALQNLTEAIFATGALPPGVYVCAHGRAQPFPGVVKDRLRGTFTRATS